MIGFASNMVKLDEPPLQYSKLKPYQEEYLDFCIQNNILQFGKFILKSGRSSPYFFNAGLFNTGFLLQKLGEFYAQAIQDHQEVFSPDILFGPAYKGIPLVSTTSIALAHQGHDIPYVFNRKEVKDHGEGGCLVGASNCKGLRALIVDDVITAGTAIRECFPILNNAGAQVAGVLVALDRMERGTIINADGITTPSELSAIQQIEKDMGVPVRAIVTMNDVLEYLENSGSYQHVLQDMYEYRSAYGIELE